MREKEKIMTEFILQLSVGIKSLFREKLNIVICLLVCILCLNLYGYNKIKKKIDHRYFNTTTSLEQIHDVDINTSNGELKVKVKP